MDPPVKLRTYIVEDNATIRENLIGTLEELASVEAVGVAETEDEGTNWLSTHPEEWDLAIVDLFLRQGSGLGVLAACRTRRPGQKMVVLSTTPRRMCACAVRNWVWMRCSTSPTRSMRWWTTACNTAACRTPWAPPAAAERQLPHQALPSDTTHRRVRRCMRWSRCLFVFPFFECGR